MNLDNFNKWLTLAANIGVIVGIVFLAIEIQQNTKVQLANSRQQILEADLSIIDDLFENPDLIVARSDPNIDELDYERVRMYWVKLLRSREFAYFQYRDGLMDEATWESYLGPLINNFQSGIGRDYIDNGRFLGNPEFVNYLRTRLERLSD